MRKIVSVLLTGTFLSLVASVANASEGLVELRNRVNSDARCFAASVLMQDQNYQILVSCRDITYPGGTEVFNYTVWANPTDGGGAFKLGVLNLGKVQFRTQKSFGTLFVTKEQNTGVSAPTGPIVMQGSVRPIALLQEKNLNTPSTTPGTNQPEIVPPSPGESLETPVPTSAPRTGVAKFLTSGILAVIGIAGIIFLLFIITKK